MAARDVSGHVKLGRSGCACHVISDGGIVLEQTGPHLTFDDA
jgi:hypothetical protein